MVVFCFGWIVGVGSAIAHAFGGNHSVHVSSNGNSIVSINSPKMIVGSGVQKTAKRACAAFDSIDVSGSVDVNIVCQKQQAVTIAADSNIIPLVRTEVRDRTLYIEPIGSYSTSNPIKITVAAPSIDQITSSGSSTIDAANIQNDALKIDTSGSGEIHLAGAANSLDITSSGSEDIKADSLTASQVTVDLSGSGDASVHAAQSLNVQISGSGQVTYSGHPPQVQSDITGAGGVQTAQSEE